MAPPVWHLEVGDGPLVATAIHDGHDVRPDVAELMALGDAERRREEDPYTGQWTSIAPTRVIGRHSRFEVDLNRPRDKAVYISPLDAWGLTVWSDTPSDALVERSLAAYDEFYAAVEQLFLQLCAANERVVVFDLHSYNHRRQGPNEPAADAKDHPEVNVGTGTMSDRRRWEKVIDRFIADLASFDFLGRRLDVRENVKFRGGNFAHWLHATFPANVCVLSIEFKKFFMDEWTGEADVEQIEAIRKALESTIPGVLAELERL
ncbi:MAG: N-formylglutamate amidohydrolase [Planctomycetota bacterium]|nr:MAG: N-formylglutamate amidohydrolase [Planctomycetota bacterium]REJ90906.1 MAG: N-formylglutamate amidohydrolase [Planctomycetota bacterium]REK17683.1 MAG: N-formylglutamate amidohydrolase [Planctomycetota bacterium]REK46736.1 MAG: N-formylglutamate amidohydrolase [Planctomycetota bacterium]